MKNIEKKVSSKIEDLMKSMGFTEKKNGVYWHMYFGIDVEFDLSASGEDRFSVMQHVFSVAVKQGRLEKQNEILSALGIKREE